MATAVSKPTITYFNLPGRAEVPRLLLEDAGVDYDFVTPSNWPELKSQLTASGKLPFGQVPLYEEPGLVLAQSSAIVRCLARKHGYNGADEHESALIDQAYEGVGDMFGQIAKTLFFTPAEQQAEAKEKLVKEFLPTYLPFFVKLLEKNGNNGFLVGAKLSYADVGLFTALHLTFTKVEGSRDRILGALPAIKSFYEGVAQRERIRAYLARDVYASK